MARTTIEMQVRLRAWQPIETAPRDGTPILACHDYTQRTDLAAHPRTVAWIDRVGHGSPCWRNAYGHIERHITHWMPLPDPPKAAGVSVEEVGRAAADATARADRYLAAMTAYVDARIADGICIARDGEPMPVAFERTELAIRAIRAIVEEARRAE